MNKPVALTTPPIAGGDPQILLPNGVLSRPVLVCLLILTGLAMLGALYMGKEVILPIVLALVLKLLLQPVADILRERLRIPTAMSAVILILGLFGSVVTVGFSISGPATAWI